MIGSNEVVTYMLILMNILFIAIILAYFLSRIDKKSKRLHAAFIKGKWQRKGKDHSGYDWHINYTFTEQRFMIEAIPLMQQEGNYKIVSEMENLLMLELMNVTGDTDKTTYYLQIAVDKKDNKIAIDGRTFKRLSVVS